MFLIRLLSLRAGAELSGDLSHRYKFTGYERDTETGIDYAFARYYNPRIGRFMSGDPISGDASDPQSYNRYSYTRSNPVNLIDPSGLSPDMPGFCDASMSSCAGSSGPIGPGRRSFGSAASQLWGTAMAQYLQQVYNASIRIGPDGNLYRPHEQVCSGMIGGPMSCTDRGRFSGGLGSYRGNRKIQADRRQSLTLVEAS